MAERVGFEPTEPKGSRALQARAVGRTMQPLHAYYGRDYTTWNGAWQESEVAFPLLLETTPRLRREDRHAPRDVEGRDRGTIEATEGEEGSRHNRASRVAWHRGPRRGNVSRPSAWSGDQAQQEGDRTQHQRKHNTGGRATLAEEQRWRKHNATGSATLAGAQRWQERSTGGSTTLAGNQAQQHPVGRPIGAQARSRRHGGQNQQLVSRAGGPGRN